LLFPAFARGVPAVNDLRRVRQRRLFPTKVVQAFQVAAQNGFLKGLLGGSKGKMKPPLALRAFAAIPLLRRFAGYFIGVGVRPEHIRTPAA
jgi:hypothetical protein